MISGLSVKQKEASVHVLVVLLSVKANGVGVRDLRVRAKEDITLPRGSVLMDLWVGILQGSRFSPLRFHLMTAEFRCQFKTCNYL